MFSLIITIIPIALVAALAIATIYYGGSVFGNGNVRAQAAAALTASQQIAGANNMYTADFSQNAASVDALVSAQYLSNAPATVPGATSYLLTQRDITSSSVSTPVCDELHKEGGSLPGQATEQGAYTPTSTSSGQGVLTLNGDAISVTVGGFNGGNIKAVAAAINADSSKHGVTATWLYTTTGGLKLTSPNAFSWTYTQGSAAGSTEYNIGLGGAPTSVSLTGGTSGQFDCTSGNFVFHG